MQNNAACQKVVAPTRVQPWKSARKTLASLGIVEPSSRLATLEVKAGGQLVDALNGAIASVNDLYVWRQDLLLDMVGFWEGSRRSAMFIGPSGSGKTTVVEQWHARLLWPLRAVTGHKRLQWDEVFGSYVPTEGGGLKWADGPLIEAAREGTSFLFNELNACDPDMIIAINDIAQEGSLITIPFTGETVRPAPGFRIFATKNPEGTVYAGRKAMDTSTRHRFKNYEVGFPDADDEKRIVARVFQSLGVADEVAAETAKKMVELASMLRPRCMEVSDAPDAIPEVISTRILSSWAEEWVRYMRRPGAVHKAMRVALTYNSDPVSRVVIHDTIDLLFGVDEKGEVSSKQNKAGA